MKARLLRILFSIVTRNIVTFLVILTLIVVPLVYRYLQDVEELMGETIAVRLDTVAQLGRFMLDVEEVAQIRNRIWYETPEYERMVRTLATLQRNFEVDNAVLMRRGAQGRFVYIADGSRQFDINQPVTLHQRFPETLPPARRAWSTGRVGETELFQSGGSKWFQINMPLKVGDEVVAVLLLNKFATPIAAAIDQRQRQILLGMALALGGGIAVWWFLTSRRLRPLLRLTAASRQIAAGELALELPADRSRSEIAALNDAFRTMVADLRQSRAEIEEHNRTLEQRIAGRTREIQSLLDNMDEGLFTMDAQGRIDPRYSAATADMLGRPVEGSNFIERLHPDPDVRRQARDTFGLLLGGMIQVDWDDMVSHLPRELEPQPGRHLRARYRPVAGDDGAPARVMVILQDVTQEKLLQQDIDRNRHLHNMVVQIIQNRETFELFYNDALRMLWASVEAVKGMRRVRRGTVDELFRTMHTIKGTAGLFGMSEVAAEAHAIEETFRQLSARRDEPFPPAEGGPLAGRIEGLRRLLVDRRNAFLDLVGEDESEASYTLAESKIDRITGEVLERVPAGAAEPVRRVLARLKHVSTARLLRKYRSLVESVGERLGKQVQLTIEEKDHTEVPADYFQKLDPTFLHILRNAMDHGIEPPEERTGRGKDAQAHIAIRTEYRGEGLLFSIADDGQGIDLERIRAVARERGFFTAEQAAAASREELLKLLFEPRFSSRSEVTDLSGRGVGLDVVRHEVEQMGGLMRLSTRRGHGTTFQLYYPLPA